MLTNKIFNASALETIFMHVFSFYQIYLCLLSNVFLLTTKCKYDCSQI